MAKIILSTDIGSDSDDAIALLAMINQNMPLDSIYCINGQVEYRAAIAKQIGYAYFWRELNVLCIW